MKSFIKKVLDSFGPKPKPDLTFLRLATKFEEAARDYDISDPYLSGKNAGRAEICRLIDETYKNR